MAIQTLALVYNTTTGKVTFSGLTNALSDKMRKFLTANGIVFEPGAAVGRLIDRRNFNAKKRAGIITRFREEFDHPLNAVDEDIDSTAVINEGDTFAADDVTLTVDDGTQFAATNYIKIDQEVLYVSGVAGNNLTVTRGEQGTTAATHADGSTVYHVSRFVATLTAG